eukprot:TRINITY_DN25238_c0_g2_i2.p2 TRINITY_DN25238_c0_g2~~TRINITY_DN25238_c0_g2_i2.p2  ORF type:complete len:239 (+),score=83.88 TRINITY_DN25238_c0_g2_i2:846-1562(+)
MAAVVVAGLSVQKAASKRQRKEEAEDRNGAGATSADKDLVKLVARLSLTNARQAAQLTAATHEVMTFDKQDGVGKKIVETTKDITTTYAAQMKVATPEEKLALGSPHSFIWLGLIQVMQQEIDANVAELKIYSKEIIAWNAWLGEEKTRIVKENGTINEDLATRLATMSAIRTCRISKCWNPAMARIELAGSHAVPEAGKVINTVMKLIEIRCKGTRRHGQAPKSDVERKIEKLLSAK